MMTASRTTLSEAKQLGGGSKTVCCFYLMEGNAALIAVFNRLADSDDPSKKIVGVIHFCCKKTTKGTLEMVGGTAYVSVVKFLEYQWRITTGGCTSKLRNQETNYSDYDYDYE